MFWLDFLIPLSISSIGLNRSRQHCNPTIWKCLINTEWGGNPNDDEASRLVYSVQQHMALFGTLCKALVDIKYLPTLSRECSQYIYIYVYCILFVCISTSMISIFHQCEHKTLFTLVDIKYLPTLSRECSRQILCTFVYISTSIISIFQCEHTTLFTFWHLERGIVEKTNDHQLFRFFSLFYKEAALKRMLSLWDGWGPSNAESQN